MDKVIKGSKVVSKIIFMITLGILILIVLLMLIFQVRFYKINGTSMEPTLEENEYVLTYKTEYNSGDVIAYIHNDVVMIKRVIGLPGDVINMDDDGTVYVNGNELIEDYIKSKALGDVEIEFPFTVPYGTYFVLGDNRADSLDSRIVSIGCIYEDDVVGKVRYSLIPLKTIE